MSTNRKFRYYITNLFEGEVQGTDDTKVAEEASNCDEMFIVDTETGSWIINEEPIQIEEFKE